MLRITLVSVTAFSALLAGCSGPSKEDPQPRRSGFTWATPEPPVPSASPPPGPPIVIPSGTWASWALLDRRTGHVVELGGNLGTSTTESMIKVAIAAAYLSGLEKASREPTASELDLLGRTVRHSDNEAAESLYRRGGGDAMLKGVLSTCQLLSSNTKPGWWSETQMTANDAARMGDCIASGRIAGPEWTMWLLGEMRSVEGVGRFGIITARPADDGRPLAIKNGWTVRDDGWHVNCLAVSTWWALAVMTRYPAQLGMAHGAKICAAVGDSLAPREATTPPPSVRPA